MTSIDLFVPTKAGSNRQKKFCEEVRFHLGQLFTRADFPPVRNANGSGFLTYSAPITITYVEISADLRHATVYISALHNDERHQMLEFVRLQKGYIRKTIASKIKLRYTPDFHFKLDENLHDAHDLLEKIAKIIAEDEHKAKHYEGEASS